MLIQTLQELVHCDVSRNGQDITFEPCLLQLDAIQYVLHQPTEAPNLPMCKVNVLHMHPVQAVWIASLQNKLGTKSNLASKLRSKFRHARPLLRMS